MKGQIKSEEILDPNIHRSIQKVTHALTQLKEAMKDLPDYLKEAFREELR